MAADPHVPPRHPGDVDHDRAEPHALFETGLEIGVLGPRPRHSLGVQVKMGEGPRQGGRARVVSEEQQGQDLGRDLVVREVRSLLHDPGETGVRRGSPLTALCDPLPQVLPQTPPVPQGPSPGRERAEVHVERLQEEHPGALEGEEKGVHELFGVNG